MIEFYEDKQPENGLPLVSNPNDAVNLSEYTLKESFFGDSDSEYFVSYYKIRKTTVKGIYTDSNVNSAKNITLLGDKSIAIHNFGKNSQYTTDININNSGNIKLGTSSNRNDPSIGIYTKYANVNHQGTIETGDRSLGIFSETPLSLTSNGSIKVGNEGLGIYKKQGVATISGAITTGNSATAVYADNNVTINNNSTNISVGDNSFGFIVLNNGTNNYNSSATSNFTMGSKSVYYTKLVLME